MNTTIASQINALRTMKVTELRVKYQEVYGEPTRSGNRDWLWKRIAWRIQELEYGSLTDRAKRRAAELADESNIRIRMPKDALLDDHKKDEEARKIVAQVSRDRRVPITGTVLTRLYKGATHTVKVVDGGFEYEGRKYGSLSAVAQEITGNHWNGYKFFNL